MLRSILYLSQHPSQCHDLIHAYSRVYVLPCTIASPGQSNMGRGNKNTKMTLIAMAAVAVASNMNIGAPKHTIAPYVSKLNDDNLGKRKK